MTRSAQEAARTYISQHDIEKTMSRLMDALLQEKPQDPREFILSYLCKNLTNEQLRDAKLARLSSWSDSTQSNTVSFPRDSASASDQPADARIVTDGEPLAESVEFNGEMEPNAGATPIEVTQPALNARQTELLERSRGLVAEVPLGDSVGGEGPEPSLEPTYILSGAEPSQADALQPQAEAVADSLQGELAEAKLLDDKADSQQAVPSEVKAGIEDGPSKVKVGIEDGPSEIKAGIEDGLSEIKADIQDEPSKVKAGIEDGPAEITADIQDEPSKVKAGIEDGPAGLTPAEDPKVGPSSEPPQEPYVQPEAC